MNWEAISSVITCIAICLTSITGLVSIKLSVKALDISKDMSVISQCSIDMKINNIRSNLLMDGSAIFNKDDLYEGAIVLKLFHEYFCDLMELPDDLLNKIARIPFRYAHESIDYLKLRYNLDDDNLAFVIKFYLEKNYHILKYKKYFDTNQILIDYWNKLYFFEKRIYSQFNDKESIKYIFDILIRKDVICLMYKIHKKNVIFACETYYPELIKNNFKSLHFYDLNYINTELNSLEKTGDINGYEYILLKRIRNYLINHK